MARLRTSHRIALLLVLAGAAILLFTQRITDHASAPVREGISLNGGPAETESTRAVARGEHAAQQCCVRCHGNDLAGGEIMDSAASEVSLAANLTRDGLGAQYRQEDLLRVLRDGHRPDGSRVSAVMPAIETRILSDDEIHALWMFLQTLPRDS